MASVVFMRGVNVGGRKTFRPAVLARQLASYDVVNVGAAGTFVVRKTVGEAALRAALLRKLPFEAELMICPARALLDLASREPFPAGRARKDARRFVSVLAKRPRTLPRLPIRRPDGDDWQVEIVGVASPFVLSLWRRTGRTLVYPNEVVEKALGVAATTRGWDTIAAVCDVLGRGGQARRRASTAPAAPSKQRRRGGRSSPPRRTGGP